MADPPWRAIAGVVGRRAPERFGRPDRAPIPLILKQSLFYVSHFRHAGKIQGECGVAKRWRLDKLSRIKQERMPIKAAAEAGRMPKAQPWRALKRGFFLLIT